jgi:hypothetical protein
MVNGYTARRVDILLNLETVDKKKIPGARLGFARPCSSPRRWKNSTFINSLTGI